MRAFASATLLFLLAAGCSTPNQDFQAGYTMASPPLVSPVYDERELRTQPLDPSRKIAEQDCSGQVDLTRGNLRCR